MNINGITAGIEEATAVGNPRSLGVDVTVSDLGVQSGQRAVVTRPIEVPSQITSTPALQAALTDEEASSLVQYFGTATEDADGGNGQSGSTTYDLSGRIAGAGVRAAHGRLVDLTG